MSLSRWPLASDGDMHPPSNEGSKCGERIRGRPQPGDEDARLGKAMCAITYLLVSRVKALRKGQSATTLAPRAIQPF